MIVQHLVLWCAALLAAGTAVGLLFPLPCYLPLLAAAVVACLLLRKSSHLHDVLTIAVWLLIGCSRAYVYQETSGCPQGQCAFAERALQKAGRIQDALAGRLEGAHLTPSARVLCSALVLGKKDGLTRETRQAYARAGASHLLALSGMHLGIIYGLLYLVLIRWVRLSRWRWHALPLILLLLWSYTLVAGKPVSLVRAAIMLSVFTVAWLRQYTTDPLHPLALSAIIILLVSPTALFSISFQLSFSAVFFIIALWGPLSESFPKLPWALRMLAVSCIAQLGTMPLTLYYFHQLPLLAPLFSLVLIPLTTLIIYLTLAALVLPLAPLGQVLSLLVALQQEVVDLGGSLPGGTLTGFCPDGIWVALTYGALMIAIVRLRTR